MELHEVYEMAEDLFEEHLAGEGWTFGFDNAKTRGGVCYHHKRKITVSRHLMVLWSEEEVRDILLHEIAHAIAGGAAKHGPKWRAVVREIGGKPEARHDNEVAPAPYVGTCARGHEFKRYRASAAMKRGHLICLRDETRIEWSGLR